MFLEIEGLWQPFMVQSIGTIFFPPKAFAYYMSLHHILVILAYIPKLHQQKLKTMVNIFFSNEVF